MCVLSRLSALHDGVSLSSLFVVLFAKLHLAGSAVAVSGLRRKPQT